MLTWLVFYFRPIKLIGDIALDDSLLRSNVSLGSIRPHAQDELINDEDDDELLTSGIVDPVDLNVEALVDQVPLVHLSDDDDDEELLTSGIVSPVNEVLLTSDNINDAVVVVQNTDTSAITQFPPESDDEDDDELLTSGIIDSGDEAVVEDEATNRSAENARIISQLVGDNDDDISDEDLLADEASQDEY